MRHYTFVNTWKNFLMYYILPLGFLTKDQVSAIHYK